MIDQIEVQRVLRLMSEARALRLPIPAEVAELAETRRQLEAALAEAPSTAEVKERIARKAARGERITSADKTDLAVADEMKKTLRKALQENIELLARAWKRHGDEVRPALDEALAAEWAPIMELAPRVTPEDTPESLLARGRADDGRALLDVEDRLRRLRRLRAFQAALNALAPYSDRDVGIGAYAFWWEGPLSVPDPLHTAAAALELARSGNRPRARTDDEVTRLRAELRERAEEEREQARRKIPTSRLTLGF